MIRNLSEDRKKKAASNLIWLVRRHFKSKRVFVYAKQHSMASECPLRFPHKYHKEEFFSYCFLPAHDDELHDIIFGICADFRA